VRQYGRLAAAWLLVVKSVRNSAKRLPSVEISTPLQELGATPTRVCRT